MNIRYFFKLPILHIVPILLLIVGCMGHYQDVTSRSCVTLVPGMAMHIVQWDDAMVDGTFLKMEKMPFDQYCGAYKRILSHNGLASQLPVPGERIQFKTVLIPDKIWKGILVGFCTENIWVRLNNETEISRFYIRGITALTGLGGHELGRADFRQLMETNSLPLLSSLVITTGNDVKNIAIHDTKSIEYYDNGKLSPVHVFTDDVTLEKTDGLLTNK